jgi:hypothetical protein
MPRRAATAWTSKRRFPKRPNLAANTHLSPAEILLQTVDTTRAASEVPEQDIQHIIKI